MRRTSTHGRASVAKADDAGVLLDRRLGAGVLGKALPKAVRMSEVPFVSFELTGVNAFDEEEREVGMLLHPMTCYGAATSSCSGAFGLQMHAARALERQPQLEVPRREKGLPSLLEMKRNITHRFSLNTQPDGAFTLQGRRSTRGRMDEDFLPPLPEGRRRSRRSRSRCSRRAPPRCLRQRRPRHGGRPRGGRRLRRRDLRATLAEQRKAVDAWKQKQRRAKVERSKHVFDDRDAPFWEKEDQTIAYWIYASAGVVLLVIMLLLCAPAKPEDDDEKRD